MLEPTKIARDGLSPEERERLAAERAKNFTAEQQKRYADKKARREETKICRQKPSIIRQWAREKSDSLVIAADYDPEAILMALLPYLGRSKPFVVYSEFLEVSAYRFMAAARKISVIFTILYTSAVDPDIRSATKYGIHHRSSTQ